MPSVNSQAWTTLEKLIAPEPDLRERGLDDLVSQEGFQESPLMIYILATRLSDPDLEVRFHAIQIMGKLLRFDKPDEGLPEQSFRTVTEFTTQMDKGQLIKLLEVSARYLSAEEALVNILKLCSYAGDVLDGIVNDRKQPVEIRQQAIHYCGEVGFLSTEATIANLIQRIEKNKVKSGLITSRKKHLDEESLIPYAISALAKLEIS